MSVSASAGATSVGIRKIQKLGFSLIEILIVVFVIGLLAALAIPRYVKSKESTHLAMIYNNLRVIDHAKDQWAIENGAAPDDEPTFSELAPYIKNLAPEDGGDVPDSVAHEIYRVNPVNEYSSAELTVALNGLSGTISRAYTLVQYRTGTAGGSTTGTGGGSDDGGSIINP